MDVVQFKKALGPMHVLSMGNLSQDGVVMKIFFCSLKAYRQIVYQTVRMSILNPCQPKKNS